MEFLILFAIGFLIRGSLEHSKGDRGQARDQRVREVAKTFPKGALPKSKQRSAARHAAAGWWAREIRHGFPVHRTGWHAAWLAHQTVADHHKARREEARTTALETRASVLKGMPEHKQRQAEAQAELDKIQEELAAQQAKGSPATGKRAVREAADEVSRKRKEREQSAGPRCPGCGAPEGYEHLEGCDPSAPPLPADAVRRPEPVVIDTPVRLHNAEDSEYLLPGEPRCEGCGGTGRNDDRTDACPVCRGWGAAHVGPEFMSAAPAGASCEACGRKGTAEDPVLIAPGGTRTHRSHAAELHEAYADALKRQYPDDGEIDAAVMEADSEPISPTASPTTQGAPMTAETTYRQVLTYDDELAAGLENAAGLLSKDITVAMQVAEDLQGADADAATISAHMELADRLRTAEASLKAAEEQVQVAKNALQQHSGLHEAHQNSPVRAADKTFYED